MKFSEKYGYVSSKKIQIESIDDVLRNRLINAVENHLNEYNTGAQIKAKNYVLDKYGYSIDPDGCSLGDYKELLDTTKVYWYKIYDIIEMYFEYAHEWEADGDDYSSQWKYDLKISLNKVLEEEKSGYRIINYQITPITNSSELTAVEQASSTEFNTVNTHIAKALDLYADRHTPDYENSIKESISAVESMCCIITGESGAQATLGNTIKKLKEHGIQIHPAMEDAFKKLYGYTSDEDGIRHGGIDFANAPAEDAKFMLISCSAFINYLIEKYTKIKGE